MLDNEGTTRELMEFECRACRKMFTRVWFEVARSIERVQFDGPSGLPEVETSHADGLAEFCSRDCLGISKQGVMEEQGVPIPSNRPGIGPVETCAKCSGPVDTSDWHLTFAEGKLEEQHVGVATLEHDYIAVVCKKCSPSRQVKLDAFEVDAMRVEHARPFHLEEATVAPQSDSQTERLSTPRQVVATVSVVVEDFEFVQLEIGDGDTLQIGKRTAGVSWQSLKVGQRVLCEVTGVHAVRVERAQQLD